MRWISRIAREAVICSYRVLDLLLPPQCVICGRVNSWLCDECVAQIPLCEESICEQCGRPWETQLCPTCRSSPLHVAPIRSAFVFEEKIRDVLHVLKYRGGRDVVLPLSKPLASAWKKYGLESDLLAPVPLYPHRELRRGYNQSALLAYALGREIHIPVAPQLLSRVRNTPSQTKLNRQERQRNMEGAFICQDVDLSGKRIMLIDDVATTGSTLDACAQVLLHHHAKSVGAFTVARAA